MIEDSTGRQFAYDQFYSLAGEAANQMVERGVCKQQRVALLLNNSAEFAAFYFACLFLGAVAVPVNPSLHPEENFFILSHSDVCLVVCSPLTKKLLEQTERGSREPVFHLLPLCEVDKDVDHTVDWLRLGDSPARFSDREFFQSAGDEDLFSITFTSGTTSLPKGVAHRVSSLSGNARAFDSLLDITAENRFLHALPMAYMAGFLNDLLCPFMAGGSILLMPPFDARMAISVQDTYRLVEEGLKERPWLMTVAGKEDREPQLIKSSPTGQFEVSIPENGGMREMIEALWKLPRDLVPNGYDAALQALAAQVPMTVHEYPTGTSCRSWLVPEKWACHEAYLETLDGERLFSYEDNPLHVASYSQSFEGVVSREELFRHLTAHDTNAEAISYRNLFDQRTWGLSCSQKTRDTLVDEQYRVVVRSEFSFGVLKVGEAVVQGESDECIVLCAHLDHPAQANNGLAGVVVGVDVMRELLRRNLHYTYRFLIVPRNIGPAAYLSDFKDLIPSMKGVLFLDMLGLNHPHILQMARGVDSAFKRLSEVVFKEIDPQGKTGDFGRVVVNDDQQFNAAGVHVPMLSLLRLAPPGQMAIYIRNIILILIHRI